jgi:hypothetical protein
MFAMITTSRLFVRRRSRLCAKPLHKTTSPFSEQTSFTHTSRRCGAADDANFMCAVQRVVGESGFPVEPSSVAARENTFSAWHKTRGFAAV